jgi:membrane-associated phospholipid phosphatase
MRRKYLAAIVSTACLILPLYALCPGAGPVYLFRDHYPYPDSLPIPLLNPHPTFLPAGLILNTTPSGHVTWALLLFWFTYKYCRRRVAGFFAAMVGLTIVATLGLGEHYVIDLILAVPFAAAIWELVQRRWKPCCALLAVVVAWQIALREGWALLAPMPVMWLLCAATVLISLPFREMRPSPDVTPLEAPA